MSVCFLLLGTNMGEKETNLQQAFGRISNEIGQVITASSIYRTSAWGKEDQEDFLNQVLKVETDCVPVEVLRLCLTIEKELGRVRYERWGTRLIDIDVLYYDKEVINQSNLVIPHPQIQNRRFTLVPLVEIARDFVHPVLGKSQLDLLEECKDVLEVKSV
ncbi:MULTISPECIES: 2-amino-4-hydroxy-6-hydroxymethyldihydropteridine diphosphokinase [Reichenbachiella]|uniref:2-amino-4-hydroxy-6- hydroxymethyldihydropteridine diphosphokinase n=1 Tax=Reichenbachiella TaxID=156993 RepID=UPI000C14E14D|nr:MULTISPECIES: 2-amino-4-hydroxy-6-hydroxymethyldihydropteridine diphosphokinase [Reichenbachiella]MBU2913415.1 2-amino-4-hydroxy-6-hydroxymethyldihydropteridine diphosphokinase [Reichenbachiella agariperforans]PIB35784.1 2-amino-4-hydroxy-6-hydroxymethyldihydropteridine diphosphokinase [Reichenbachiella sp. 5M10]RJE74607.1 2-amino-4-hydroxy-6-hydroxymethyldihydropteridine diphosphokinase [Reichenbachiella sp. MSK19-1]